MQTRRSLPFLCALSSLLFGAALLLHEHLHGGVRSHHLLDRPDLPAISNGWGLLVLPLLGWLLGMRLRQAVATPTAPRPIGMLAALTGAALYGGALAMSFALGAAGVSSGLFFGAFLLAVVLPVYRIEYVLGFVLGMAFTFGAVLPALVAAVIATVSAALRFGWRALRSAIRSPAGQRAPERP